MDVKPDLIDDKSELEKELEALSKRPFWQQLADYLFGYDFFISYSWKDGATYAVRLAAGLKQRGFDCFLDVQSYDKGDDWKAIGAASLRRTSQLILVGTPGALSSAPVFREVRIFAARGRKIVPIDLGGALDSTNLSNHPLFQFVTAALLRIAEPASHLSRGPSSSTLDDLQNGFRNLRQSIKRMRALKAVALSLCVLLVAAVGFWRLAESRRQQADAARQQAEVRRLEAEDAKKDAELKREQADAARRDASRKLGALEWFTADRDLDEGKALLAAHQYYRSAIDLYEGGDPDGSKSPGFLANQDTIKIIRTFVHDSPVNGAKYSRDGSLLLTWTGDKAWLWPSTMADSVKGNLGPRDLNPNQLNGAIFSHDDRHVLTWSRDEYARLWDVSNPAHPIAAFHHGHVIRGALFNRAESRLLTWGDDGTAQLWDVAHPEKALRRFPEDWNDKTFLEGASFSPDEQQLIIWGGIYGSAAGIAQLWNIDNATTPIATFQDPNKETIFEASLNRDGTRLLTYEHQLLLDSGSARLWDPANPAKPIATFGHEGGTRGAMFLERGDRILTWGEDGKAIVWMTAHPETAQATLKSTSGIRGVTISADHKVLLTWDDQGEARSWDLAKPTQSSAEFTHPKPIDGALLSADNTRLLTWSKVGTAWLWDAFGSHQIGTIESGAPILGAMFAPDVKQVVIWSADGTARIWDPANSVSKSTNLKQNSIVTDAAFSSDGNFLIDVDGYEAWLWDLMHFSKPPKRFSPETYVYGATMSHNNRLLLTWGKREGSKAKGIATLWDVAHADRPLDTMNHSEEVDGGIFTSNDGKALTWSRDGIAKMWDLSKAARTLTTFNYGHDTIGLGALLSPNEDRILLYGLVGAKLWNVADATTPLAVFEQNGDVRGSLFTRDGRRVIVWGIGFSPKLLSVDNSQRASADFRVEGDVEGAQLSDDDSHVLLWDSEGKAHLWPLEPNQPPVTFDHEGSIEGAFMTRDMSRVLTWGWDGFRSKKGCARLWDTTKPERPIVTLHFDTPVQGALLLSDQHHFLTRSRDSQLNLWDMEHTDRPLEILEHSRSIHGATSNSQGLIASWGEDKGVRLWWVGLNDPIPLNERLLDFEIRSGTQLDSDGSLRTLRLEELRSKRTNLEQLRSRVPAPNSSGRAQ